MSDDTTKLPPAHFVLGRKSQTTLKGVHPTLVGVVERAIQLTRQDFTVFEGVRTLETQRKYMARGVTRTMKSKHLIQTDGFGHAVDLVPIIDGGPRWEWPPIFEIALAMDQAATEQDVSGIIRWGGVWDKTLGEYGGTSRLMSLEVAAYGQRHPGPDFIDGPHYELVL